MTMLMVVRTMVVSPTSVVRSLSLTKIYERTRKHDDVKRNTHEHNKLVIAKFIISTVIEGLR